MHPFERWIARRYLTNALKAKRRKTDRPNEYFQAWTSAYGRLLGVAALRYKSESGRDYEYEGREGKLKFKAEWRRWLTAAIASAGDPTPPISPLQKRIDWLGDVCELNASQRFLLGPFARIARVQQVRNLISAINGEDYVSDQFDFTELRPVLDAPGDKLDLSDNGLLTRFGLNEKDDNGNFQISDLVGAIFRGSGLPRRKSGLFFSASRRPLLWAGTTSRILANCANLPRGWSPTVGRAFPTPRIF